MVNFSQSASCSGGAASGVEGALSGIANIFGLGSLVSAIPGMDDEQDEQNKLSAAQANLAKVTSQWQATITNEKFQIAEDSNTFLQSLINAAQQQDAVIDEILNEKVSTNSLMIATLAVLVIFLILYDII
jgi:predicted PurR-regulated permease PerM